MARKFSDGKSPQMARLCRHEKPRRPRLWTGGVSLFTASTRVPATSSPAPCWPRSSWPCPSWCLSCCASPCSSGWCSEWRRWASPPRPEPLSPARTSEERKQPLVRSRVMSFSFSLSLRALPAYSSILRPNARKHDSLRRLWQLTNSDLWWLMFIRVAV